MPKNEINYSKTIIYKICCKNKSIKQVYIGYTTNFIKRRYLHKFSCQKPNNKLKIYDAIRDNGGWNNWEMIELANYNCKNSEEAKIKEQYHFEDEKMKLNNINENYDKTILDKKKQNKPLDDREDKKKVKKNFNLLCNDITSLKSSLILKNCDVKQKKDYMDDVLDDAKIPKQKIQYI